MTYYAISTRTIDRKADDAFGSEPADPSFLISPAEATSFRPSHKLKGRRAQVGKNWASRILEDARQRAEDVGAAPDGQVQNGDIVMLVHGYNMNAESAFARHRAFVEHYKSPAYGLTHAVFVSFDWPAMGSVLNYVEDGMDARKSAFALVESGLKLFALFSAPECNVRVHVLAHSMGAMVTREALRTATDFRATRDRAWSINQLVLASADISVASFAGRDSWAMQHYSQRVTNYFNRHDKALATSNVKRVLTAPRLGRHGAPSEMWSQIADVDTSDRWLKSDVQADGTLTSNFMDSHGFYFDDPVWLQDFAYTVLGNHDRQSMPTRSPHPRDQGRLKLRETASS